MNNLCQFKRGFFTLRTCNRPAQKQCETCNLLSCQYHLSTPSEMRVCVKCERGRNPNQVPDQYDDDWVYSYRNSYYANGYLPFRFGNQDHESFVDYSDDNLDWDDDYAGDFTDS